MTQPSQVDVAIIGGGAAGCLLALALGQAGLSVTLLERGRRLPFNGGDFLKPPQRGAVVRATEYHGREPLRVGLDAEVGQLDAMKAALEQVMEGADVVAEAVDEEGRLLALRQVIVELLVLRGDDTEALRHQINLCEDPSTLERWFRALAAHPPKLPVAEIFG